MGKRNGLEVKPKEKKKVLPAAEADDLSFLLILYTDIFLGPFLKKKIKKNDEILELCVYFI